MPHQRNKRKRNKKSARAIIRGGRRWVIRKQQSRISTYPCIRKSCSGSFQTKHMPLLYCICPFTESVEEKSKHFFPARPRPYPRIAYSEGSCSLGSSKSKPPSDPLLVNCWPRFSPIESCSTRRSHLSIYCNLISSMRHWMSYQSLGKSPTEERKLRPRVSPAHWTLVGVVRRFSWRDFKIEETVNSLCYYVRMVSRRCDLTKNTNRYLNRLQSLSYF
jgi:sulfur relay (sulfurtransferase) DsrC/TusE family protein